MRYYQGIASQRPYAYFVWANIAAWLISCSPLLVVGIARAVGVLSRWRRDSWSSDRAVALLGLSGVLAALVADLSGLSKAETERIWLSFGAIAWTTMASAAGQKCALDAGGRRGVGDRGQPPSRYGLVIRGATCSAWALGMLRAKLDRAGLVPGLLDLETRSRGNVAELLVCAPITVSAGRYVRPCQGMDYRGRAGIVSSTIHDGPGVIPGRYAGEAIPIIGWADTASRSLIRQHKTRRRWVGWSDLRGCRRHRPIDAAPYWSWWVSSTRSTDDGFGPMSNPWHIGCRGRVDVAGSGSGACPGRQGAAPDAHHHRAVSGGPAVLLQGPRGNPGG